MAKRSKDGYWEFTGVKVKKGESLKKAAIRELREETGLNLSEEDMQNFRKGDSYLSGDDD